MLSEQHFLEKLNDIAKNNERLTKMLTKTLTELSWVRFPEVDFKPGSLEEKKSEGDSNDSSVHQFKLGLMGRPPPANVGYHSRVALSVAHADICCWG